MSETMDDMMDVIEVLLNEVSDPRVLRDGLISPFQGFIAGCRAADGHIIKKWLSDIRDFRF